MSLARDTRVGLVFTAAFLLVFGFVVLKRLHHQPIDVAAAGAGSVADDADTQPGPDQAGRVEVVERTEQSVAPQPASEPVSLPSQLAQSLANPPGVSSETSDVPAEPAPGGLHQPDPASQPQVDMVLVPADQGADTASRDEIASATTDDSDVSSAGTMAGTQPQGEPQPPELPPNVETTEPADEPSPAILAVTPPTNATTEPAQSEARDPLSASQPAATDAAVPVAVSPESTLVDPSQQLTEAPVLQSPGEPVPSEELRSRATDAHLLAGADPGLEEPPPPIVTYPTNTPPTDSMPPSTDLAGNDEDLRRSVDSSTVLTTAAAEDAGDDGSLPPVPKTTPAPRASVPVTQQAAKPTQRTYRVRRGDSLWTIARRVLGRGSRWKEIYELNRDILPNPHRLKPGIELKLPVTSAVAEKEPKDRKIR